MQYVVEDWDATNSGLMLQRLVGPFEKWEDANRHAMRFGTGFNRILPIISVAEHYDETTGLTKEIVL